MSKHAQTYDVVIIGGGIAGTALACSLASNPIMSRYRIALIEAMDLSPVEHWESEATKYSNRVVSLTPTSMSFLQEIGVASNLLSDRVHPFYDMQVWDGVTDARIEFNTSNLRSENVAMAYIVENIHIQHTLLKRLLELKTQGNDIDIITKTKVLDIGLDGQDPVGEELNLSDWPTITLENGSQIKARLLVGADGVNSPVRCFADIKSLGWDYDAQGVVATLRIDPSMENHIAWQRFLPTGPIAMLPLGNGFASMVWSTQPHIAKLIKSLPPDQFCHLVNAAFRLTMADLSYMYSIVDTSSTAISSNNISDEYHWRESVISNTMTGPDRSKREAGLPPLVLGVQDSSRASFPLRMRNSERYVSDRIALVGDAAHVIHPLAGQGLNQGLLDVSSLSQTLASGTLDGQDIGSIHLLRNYASDRYIRNIAMMSACDKMHRLFSTDATPLTWLRTLGLSTLNRFDLVKSEIIKYAMGI